jgi:hypothetical protein
MVLSLEKPRIAVGSDFRTVILLFGVLLLARCLVENAHAKRYDSDRQERSGFRCQPPVLDPTIFQSEVLPILDQRQVNCFAWQEFLSLNWVASSQKRGKPEVRTGTAEFGTPGDRRLLVWQTYKNVSEVFLPGAKAPVPWKQHGEAVALCQALAAREKFPLPILHETNEAGITPPAWLVGQNGKKVFFEIYINRDMFEFILTNKFYDAQHQYTAVQEGGPGINAPAGKTRYGNEGAVEIKAAWIEIDDPQRRSRFKLTEALVYDLSTSPQCQKVQMGLVGLHIVHKTPAAQQWIWATFEHVDNAPDLIEVRTHHVRPHYTFYNSHCPATAPQECETNTKPECDVTSQHCTPFHPIQVVRETPFSPEIRELNARMHDTIRAANPDSVWQYYDLVNVMWPGSSKPIPPGAKVPLPHGGMQPTILTNTVIETYVQTGATQKNCLDCHASATIAPTVQASAPRWGSDYSFVLRKACDPAVPAQQCHPIMRGN